MDDKFWDLIRMGDESAFGMLYDKYADLLYGYGMKIVANDDIVSEAIQSLFVYMFEKRRTISTPYSEKSYLCVSLRRMIFSILKKEGRYRGISIEEFGHNESKFELEIDIQAAIIKTELQQEHINALQEALKDLTARQREIIYLKYYVGMSNEELSEHFGISYQSIRNTASQAIIRLRESKVLANIPTLTLTAMICRLLGN